MPSSTVSTDAAPVVSDFACDPEYRDLLEMFTGALPERTRALWSAWQARDIESLRVQAHQLKGAGGGFGYQNLTRLAAELERACKAADWQNSKTTLDRLVAYMARIVN